MRGVEGNAVSGWYNEMQGILSGIYNERTMKTKSWHSGWYNPNEGGGWIPEHRNTTSRIKTTQRYTSCSAIKRLAVVVIVVEVRRVLFPEREWSEGHTKSAQIMNINLYIASSSVQLFKVRCTDRSKHIEWRTSSVYRYSGMRLTLCWYL